MRENKKFRVISLHFTNKCNLNCPMCYKKDDSGEALPHSFFLKLVPYLSKITHQVALGGGEPFMCPDFVEKFSKKCKKYNLICNATTNGTLKDEIIEHSKYLTMLSVSFDKYKVSDLREHLNLLKELRESGIRIGSNLLIDSDMFKPPTVFVKLVYLLFSQAERVFALYPKNWEFIPILKYKIYYEFLSIRFKHFYIDDLTYKILSENRYKNWREPCHYGKDIININMDGTITGCSFSKDVAMKIEKPKDLLKVSEIKFKEFYSCPHLRC